MPRFAILFEDNFNHLYGKTGNALLRYRPEDVVCCIDSKNADKTADEVVGIGGALPVVAHVEDSLQFNPDTLLIGIATEGGYLPKNMRGGVKTAIENGLNIICGLHSFLSFDPEFSKLANKHNVTITDLRKPPDPLPFTKGSWKNRKTPILLTVGTDCDVGKMTMAWETSNSLVKNGVSAKFVGTGQTGILLSGAGVAVDAVVSDFVAGAIENEIDKINEDYDIIIVEGQGSITHMAYSGVTLGLLHGSMPDFLLMCHDPFRTEDTFGQPVYDIQKTLDLYLNLVQIFKPCRCVGAGLVTHDENEELARKTIDEYQNRFDFPINDFIRYGGKNIVENIISKLR